MRYLAALVLLAGCSRAIESRCQPSGIDNCCVELASPRSDDSSTCRASVIGDSVLATARVDDALIDLVVDEDGASVRIGACRSSDVTKTADQLHFAATCDGETYSGAFRIIATYPR
jgi:hypothetical protein